MRIESAVISLSWIPSEAIPGLMRLPFDLGPTHYDDPPPDQITDVESMARSGAVRFINELRAWADVENGLIVRYGHTGRGWMGRTKLGFGSRQFLYPTIGMPDIRPEPDASKLGVRFFQTTGGRPALPLPRKLNRPPFVQIVPPVVWTTLSLTINADGTTKNEVLGASPFPRHWIYDDKGKLVKKVAVTDFGSWSGDIFGERTPWGKEDSPAFVTEVESAVERELSHQIMRGGAKPQFRKLGAGQTLVEQGQPGNELFLLLDGVLSVDVDGKALAEVGPGAILGERALLEGGNRTATLKALTPVRVAVATADQVSPDALAEVAGGHRREETAKS
ncbi:MAG TPA: cyclic nucleotide-binding domain-containing protein [Candidatus Acidoferrum sp.]|nr:cyclic nucleotide-binding domain-containing protein [Candidatus Acidoferrum sp.]